MRKFLLSGLLLTTLFSAKAQFSEPVIGGYDNFNGEENGVYWFKDQEHPEHYSLTRANGVLEIVVDKPQYEYSVIGAGFGDSNGAEPGGEPVMGDISSYKEFELTASATKSTTIDLIIEDINGVKIELMPTNMPKGPAPRMTMNADPTPQVFTFDLTGARIIENWACDNWPVDCPTVNTTAQFDYTKVTKVMFLIANGAEYKGTVTFDKFKIGGGPDVLSTTAAKAAISSSKLYPNPATESASIEVSLKESSDVKVTLSDLMGREVAVIANERSLDVNKSFSTANLAKGMYTVNYFINGAPAKAELLMVK